MIVDFEGQQHTFPDDFTPDEISAALDTYQPPIDPLPARHIPQYAQEEFTAGMERFKEGAKRTYEAIAHPKPAAVPEASLAGAGQFISEAVAPESVRGVGEAALGAAQAAGAWPSAILRGLVGQPTGQAVEHAARGLGAAPQTARMSGEFARNLAETGAGFAVPELRLPGVLGPRAPKVVEPPTAIADTVMSRGQASGDPVQLAFEDRARKGLLGDRAQQQALEFDRLQQQRVAEQTQKLRQSLDPQRGAQPLAQTPREAGEVAQQAVQKQAQQADELTDRLFTQARGYDTQLESSIFRRMGSGIRRDIYAGESPVIVDRALTPSANAMIADLNSQPEALARRLGQKIPEGEQIAALPLEMVDRIRRRLLGLRRGAAAAARQGRGEDLRASQAVIDAFDNRIDQAINRGLFSGDPQGIQAWKDARAAHAGYRTAFTRFSRDPTSRLMEKVIGGGAAEPLIPEKVAEHIYGANVLKPTSDNVAAAQRFKRMLDPQQWGEMQLGHFEKLIDSPNHSRVADNIDTFFDTSMGNVMYSPAQRAMLKSYADLRRRLHSSAAVGVPTEVRGVADRIAQHGAGTIGAGLGHTAGVLIGSVVGHPHIGGPIGGGVGRVIGETIAAARPSARNARRIERDMRIISNAWSDYAAAVAAYQKSGTARNVARLSLAVRNLDRNLQTIGTSYQEMQQPAAPQPPPQPPAPQQRPTVTVPLPANIFSGTPLSGSAGAE